MMLQGRTKDESYCIGTDTVGQKTNREQGNDNPIKYHSTGKDKRQHNSKAHKETEYITLSVYPLSITNTT